MKSFPVNLDSLSPSDYIVLAPDPPHPISGKHFSIQPKTDRGRADRGAPLASLRAVTSPNHRVADNSQRTAASHSILSSLTHWFPQSTPGLQLWVWMSWQNTTSFQSENQRQSLWDWAPSNGQKAYCNQCRSIVFYADESLHCVWKFMSALKVFLQNIDAFLVPFIAHVGTLHDIHSCGHI